jgi:RNA polymerase sigma-70 factor (ECF subfamily)
MPDVKPAVVPRVVESAHSGFAEVYRTHANFVVRCARHQRVPVGEVEDIVHDVFLVVHHRFADFDPERATLRSWLYGITRRVVSQGRRGRQRAQRRLALVEPPTQTEAPAPDEAVARQEAVDVVARFVDHRGDKKRLVFTLSEIEGMSAPEISACLNINLNTVYSRLRLARESLRRFVAEENTGGRDGTQ